MPRLRVLLVLTLSLLLGQSASATPLSLYNLIVFENLTSHSEVEGKTFVGKNLNGPSATFGTMLHGLPAGEVSLQVGKHLNLTNLNLNNGSLEVGGKVTGNVNMNSGGNYAVGGNINGNINNGTQISLLSPPDVSSLESELLSLSATLAGLNSNSSTAIVSTNQLHFNANPTGPGNTAVFNVDGADIFQNGSLAQLQLITNNADQVIINVGGENITWNNGMNAVGELLSDVVRQKVIWNFYEATSLNIQRNFNGALLAPLAHLTNGTAIDGSVAVRSFTQHGEVHLPLSLVSAGATQVPEPGTLVIVAVALALAIPRRLRQSAVAG